MCQNRSLVTNKPLWWRILIIGEVIFKTQHSKNEDYGIQSHYFMANRWGSNENRDRLYFLDPKLLQMVSAAMKLKDTCALEEKL